MREGCVDIYVFYMCVHAYIYYLKRCSLLQRQVKQRRERVLTEELQFEVR